MGIYKSYKCRYQLKGCNQIWLDKQNEKKQKKDLQSNIMNEITKCLGEMDEIQLLTVFNTIIKANSQKASYQRANLVYIIEQLSDEELGSTIHLLSKMRYTKGYLDLILLQIILII